LAKYNLTIPEVSDPFGVKGRKVLREKIAELPPETGAVTKMLLEAVEIF